VKAIVVFAVILFSSVMFFSCDAGAPGSSWTTRSIPLENWNAVTFGNGKFVAVAGNSNSAASADGGAWTEGTAQGYSSSVACGGTTFVSLPSSMTLHTAALSTDGINWTFSSNFPVDSAWSSVCYGNGTFVGVASGTAAATSTNGSAWTAQTLPTTASWSSVCYGGSMFVAVASGGTAAATSTDGSSWLLQALPSSTNWSSVCYGNGIFLAIARSGAVATSPNGSAWTGYSLPSPGTGAWVSVASAVVSSRR
jgi:hypothetical protein